MAVQLTKGGNTGIDAARVRAVLGWSGTADVDASALLLTTGGKVRSDADFVFYNQPASPEGAVRHLGKSGTSDAVGVDLAALPAEVERVVVGASVDGATFGQVPGLHLRLLDERSGAELVRFDVPDASTETAFSFGELYRRGGGWKFRAVGQGYATGLAGLATDFGISVDDEPAPAPAPAVDLTKQRRLVDMEKRVAAQAPALVDLVKRAKVSLEKRGLGEHTARVALCLDISGSMHQMYRSGKIQQLVERVLALALRFDDDGQVDVWLFGRNAHEAGPVTLDNHASYVDDTLRRSGLEPATAYGAAMRLLREHYFGSGGPRSSPVQQPLPVYAMFVTDGATSDESATRQQVVSSSYEPLFWQFMAIGRSSRSVTPTSGGRGGGLFGRQAGGAPGGEFRFLEELDDMPGRLVDNADFFAVEDPAEIPDDQLYDLLMTEYPSWLTAARRAGLLPAR